MRPRALHGSLSRPEPTRRAELSLSDDEEASPRRRSRRRDEEDRDRDRVWARRCRWLAAPTIFWINSMPRTRNARNSSARLMKTTCRRWGGLATQARMRGGPNALLDDAQKQLCQQAAAMQRQSIEMGVIGITTSTCVATRPTSMRRLPRLSARSASLSKTDMRWIDRCG